MSSKQESLDERFFNLMMGIRRLGFDQSCLEHESVTPAQVTFLDWIAERPGSGVQEIADGLNLTPPTVSVGMRKLEDVGLVERQPNLSDKRSVQFYLTKNGDALHRKIQVAHRRKFQRILSGLSASEQKTLIELLQRALRGTEINLPEKGDEEMSKSG